MRQTVQIPWCEQYRELVECIALGHCDGSHNAGLLSKAGKTTVDLRQAVQAYRRSRLGIRDGSQIR